MVKLVVNNEALAAYRDQLERWGIDEERAEELGLELIHEEEALDDIYIPGEDKYRQYVLGAIAIPYFDADGLPMTDPALAKSEFCVRYRYLTKAGAFNSIAPEEFGKYAQEDSTKPWPYLPPLTDDRSWSEIQKDTSTAIIITEGEMKAAMACDLGLSCIALGGVWSFRSNKHGIGWLETLAEFDWKKRLVIIVYDGDVARNRNVSGALNALSEELFARGSRVEVGVLPKTIKHSETGDEVDKVGLDDYLIHEGLEKFKSAILDHALPMTAIEPLFRMSDRYCYVNTLNSLYDFETDNIIGSMSITNYFASELFNHVSYDPMVGQKMKRENIGRIWMEWPLRNNVQDLTYEPGGEAIIIEDGQQLANVWQGWGTEPKKGSVKPFLEFIDYLFGGVSEEHRKWLLQWLAYPIQHPGTKLNQAVVVHGSQGSGKTMLGQLVGKIYGKNYLLIEQAHLQSDFNGWMHGKQLILGDEISGTGSAEHRKVADKLKHYITGSTISVNRKNREPYDLPNHCNFIFTSNHPDAFFLERDDRRYFIVKVPERRNNEYYEKLIAWTDDGGIEAIHHHLLELDLEGFEPYGPAPQTNDKTDMVMSSRSDIGAWLTDNVVGQDEILFGGIKLTTDLFTTRQLRTWYEADTDRKISDQAMTMELKRLGVELVCGSGQVRLSGGGGKTRLWAVRNSKKWLTAAELECKTHYEKHHISEMAILEASERLK